MTTLQPSAIFIDWAFRIGGIGSLGLIGLSLIRRKMVEALGGLIGFVVGGVVGILIMGIALMLMVFSVFAAAGGPGLTPLIYLFAAPPIGALIGSAGGTWIAHRLWRRTLTRHDAATLKQYQRRAFLIFLALSVVVALFLGRIAIRARAAMRERALRASASVSQSPDKR